MVTKKDRACMFDLGQERFGVTDGKFQVLRSDMIRDLGRLIQILSDDDRTVCGPSCASPCFG